MDSTRLLHPWNFPDKSTGVGCHFLLQGIFPTQGSNLGLLHCRQMLYHLSHQRWGDHEQMHRCGPLGLVRGPAKHWKRELLIGGGCGLGFPRSFGGSSLPFTRLSFLVLKMQLWIPTTQGCHEKSVTRCRLYIYVCSLPLPNVSGGKLNWTSG